MKILLILLLILSISALSCTTFVTDKHNNNNNQTRFSLLYSMNWKEVFFDSGTQNWNKNWTLDGLKAKVINSKDGMEFKAGPIAKEAASHAVLWTNKRFSGDLKIEYDYTRTDEASKFVNILYIQATGSESLGYKKDISQWAEQRSIPSMKYYFNKMNTYHISYAAFGGKSNPGGSDYIRARRYMPHLGKGLKGTEILPDPCMKTELFKPGVLHHITVIKKHNELYMQIKNSKKELLCSWKNTEFPHITEGRIGLRHMATRSARYKNFRISTIIKPEKQLAFPSAEGFGAHAKGGRGGDVYHVTNLKDDGKGSLRHGIKEQQGPRTIVFDVSGTIMLNKKLSINTSHLTIAGQTAPDPGVTLAGHSFQVGADDVIVRYLRFRLGDINNQQDDAVSIKSGNNIIIDHVSASWSIDETFSSQGDKLDNLTIQWSMITESLKNSHHKKGAHGYGGILGGLRQSVHHNLYAHHSSRNPKVTGRRHTETDFRNNVIYNWGFNSNYDGTKSHINWVNNYYKPGPGTKDKVKQRIFSLSNGEISSENNNYDWSNTFTTALYAEGNYMEGSVKVTEDNWDGGIDFEKGASEILHRAKYPAFAYPAITEQTAINAYPLVLAKAGSSLFRDSVDSRIINEVKSATTTFGDNGFIDSQRDVGSWPKLAENKRPANFDTDQDGMPDVWEVINNLDPKNDSDRNGDSDGDGYTNLEEYLNTITTTKLAEGH